MTNKVNWNQVKEIFSNALELDGEVRAKYITNACGSDENLLKEVLSLIESHHIHSPLDHSIEELRETVISEMSTAENIGENVGPYKILKELGRGGMGRVYLAERADEQYQQKVALKLLFAGFSHKNQTLRFLNERQILASLNHRNIAVLLDGGITRHSQPWFAMEYVEGMPIDRYCNENQLTINQRLELFMDVCEAIQYAHQKLVVHRDIKPSNIMVKNDGTVKLLDFGIAKGLNHNHILAGQAPVTKTGLLPLTPAYASPEQVKGESVTTTSDIYQLGVVLYELLTGCPPYEVTGRTPSEIEQIICEQPPTRPSTAVTKINVDDQNESIPPVEKGSIHTLELRALQKKLKGDLDTIILKAIRKEPGRRYNSAQQFAEDIRLYLSGRPVAAHPDSRIYRAKKFIRRHSLAVVSVAVILFLLFGYAFTITWHSKQTTAALHKAQQETAKAEQVTGFLMGLFEAGRPGVSQNENITARELLERGIEQAENLEGQPEIQAQLFEVVGRVYQSLGMYDEAGSPLKQALDIRKNQFGNDHPQVAQSMHQLGVLYHYTGEYEEAEHLLRESLDIRRAHFGTEHVTVAASLNSLAMVLHATGEYDDAEAIFREVLSIRRKLLGAEHSSIHSTLQRLGNLLQDQGKFEEAEQKLRQSLELGIKLKGENHIDVASDMISFALLLQRLGMLDDAEQYNNQGLKIYRETLDDDHPYLAAAINNLAVILYEQEKYDQALILYDEALDKYKAILGEEHPGIATMMNNMGAAYSLNGNYGRAEQLYRESLTMRLDLLGPEHPDVAGSLNNLGSLLRRTGNYQEAESLLANAIEIRRSRLGDEHPALARSVTHLARLHLDQNFPDEAEPLIREALAIRQEAYPDHHPEIAESLSLLGTCLVKLGEFEDAEVKLYEAYSLIREFQDSHERYQTETLHGLINLYEKWGQPDKADQYNMILLTENGGISNTEY